MARGCRAKGLWVNLFSVQMERTQMPRAWTQHTFSASRKFNMAATQRQLHRVLRKSFNPTTASPKPLHQIRPLAPAHSGPHNTNKLDFTQPVSRAISRLGASRKAEGWDYCSAQKPEDGRPGKVEQALLKTLLQAEWRSNTAAIACCFGDQKNPQTKPVWYLKVWDGDSVDTVRGGDLAILMTTFTMVTTEG